MSFCKIKLSEESDLVTIRGIKGGKEGLGKVYTIGLGSPIGHCSREFREVEIVLTNTRNCLVVSPIARPRLARPHTREQQYHN